MTGPEKRHDPSFFLPAGRAGGGGPTILAAELESLLHLARLDALPVLHEIGGLVVIPDTVQHQLTGHAEPEARRLARWIELGLELAADAPVVVETTDYGEAVRIAQLVKPDFYPEGSCESAALWWLMDRISNASKPMWVLSDREKTRSMVVSQRTTNRIEVITTEALLERQTGLHEATAPNEPDEIPSDDFLADMPVDAVARVLRGIRIRNARFRLCMTQQALAEAAGLTRQTIIAVEKRGTMSRHTRAKIEAVLGLDLDLWCGLLPGQRDGA
ncbi:hypothetical protein GCM10007301_39010 [Azorhizobium oxalatiphilum]|uniref:HTH cro/C1-type domain-containing protein n=1 Tax=Azorhizobium oxalatiphilum TaxID=980631 RepID=A0A917FH19_9HYPH|nr:helix-turn-helix transcriptional regulator [Azorhizobium oxalatiphilum]GGF75326.1 hypothetical protein GCM10007301_39010 [Azorhizobium oxalatiphilum]